METSNYLDGLEIPVVISFKEYAALMEAILCKQIEEEEWSARTQGQETDREKRIYETSQIKLEILNKLADKLMKAYYDA